MLKISSFIKNKKVILLAILLFVIVFISFWNVVSGGYDRQNKAILFLKKFIPAKISRKIRDTIFVIPDLRERNKFLSTQVKKYEQGLNGDFFHKEIILSKTNKKEYILREFFLPFPRLDMRLGWGGEKNSTRAHHLSIVKDKVIVISGEGKTIYFKKNNILNDNLNQIEIPNNIQNILDKKNLQLIGIRDLFVENDMIYISLISKNAKGLTINAYNAELNFKKLNFKLFFETNEYWKQYNVFSGGRFSKYKDNKILFTIGYSNVKKAAQEIDSLLGKIISIDKLTNEYKIISMGHRNPQGLFYIKDLDIIINTEHGPKGGDEINVNFQKNDEIPNFGWDIASYGIEYDGTDPYKKSHSEYGFIEPLKYYVPSIGISQMIYMPNNLNPDNRKYLFVSSLRAESIYIIEMNEKFNKIVNEDRLYLPQRRIRDIDYDKENDVFFLVLEYIPSIGILKLKD